MANTYVDRFKQTLIHNRNHVTKARETTFKLLLSPNPQTISEILTNAQGKVDKVSVYRNIELFQKLGIVHTINVGRKQKLELSDQFLGHHHHLYCLNCSKTIDIEDEHRLDELIKEMSDKFGFIPQRHQFEIDGFCKECKGLRKIDETTN